MTIEKFPCRYLSVRSFEMLSVHQQKYVKLCANIGMQFINFVFIFKVIQLPGFRALYRQGLEKAGRFVTCSYYSNLQSASKAYIVILRRMIL